MLFEGVFPVVPTPLREDEQVDQQGLQHLVEHYVDTGCHGLVVMGSGGEFPYFTLEERISIITFAAEANGKRVPLVSGCGFYGLRETLAFINACRGLPLDGLLVALPTYFPLRFEDVFGYYQEVCRNSPFPILYYHFPQMTGLFFSEEELGRIVRIKGISGMKVSAFCLREMRDILAQAPANSFSLFAGVSFLLRETIAMGGCGVIDPIASFAPRLVLDAYRAIKEGDTKRAHTLQEQILDLIPVLNSLHVPSFIQKRGFRAISRLRKPLRNSGKTSRHAVIKELLRQLGHPITSRTRSPLLQITEKDRLRLINLAADNLALQREKI